MSSPPVVAVVTGATSGIGAVVARSLAQDGDLVVAVGRDPARLERTMSELRTVATGPTPEGHLADLSLASAVAALGARIRSDHPRIGLLVNVAGGVFLRRQSTAEGHELTWALNVRAPFLLTQALLPALLASEGGARVVMVASAAHRGHRLDLEDPEGRRAYRGWRAYGRSKLALILLTRALARRTPRERVAFFAVHPGFVRSRFGKNNAGAFALGIGVAMVLAISPERGARTVLTAARQPELTAASGAYLSRSRVTAPSRAAQDDPMAERLYAALAAG